MTKGKTAQKTNKPIKILVSIPPEYREVLDAVCKSDNRKQTNWASMVVKTALDAQRKGA